MSKTKLAIAPRKPVSDAVARQFEDALDRSSSGIAGSAIARTPEEPQEGSSSTPKSPAPQKPARPPKPIRNYTPPLSKSIGTRTNPRIRKTDGVKTRSTSVHLPIELARELTLFCADTGWRQSAAIAAAVEEWLERRR